MTAEELRRAAILLFGDRGWMSRLSEALGVDRSSVSRWFAGLPVPGPAAAAVAAWVAIFELTGCEPGRFLPPSLHRAWLSGNEHGEIRRSATGAADLPDNNSPAGEGPGMLR